MNAAERGRRNRAGARGRHTRGRSATAPIRAATLAILFVIPATWAAAANPAPALRPLNLRFAEDALPVATNLVAITLHPAPALAWSAPDSSRPDHTSLAGGWRRDDAPPPGTMANIAPQEAAPARTSGWLSDDKDGASREDVFGRRNERQRGWLASSVSRLQERASEAVAQDTSLWDEQFAEDEERDEDAWMEPGIGTGSRSWEPAWNDNGSSRAYWQNMLDRPFGTAAWRETSLPSSGSGDDDILRPAYGAADEER